MHDVPCGALILICIEFLRAPYPFDELPSGAAIAVLFDLKAMETLC
jgi:hypothetical protein